MPLDFRSKSLLILRHAEAEHHLGARGSCLVPEDHSTTLAEWQHTQPDGDPRPADHSSGGREIWREETDIVLSVKECRVLEGGHINTYINTLKCYGILVFKYVPNLIPSMYHVLRPKGGSHIRLGHSEKSRRKRAI